MARKLGSLLFAVAAIGALAEAEVATCSAMLKVECMHAVTVGTFDSLEHCRNRPSPSECVKSVFSDVFGNKSAACLKCTEELCENILGPNEPACKASTGLMDEYVTGGTLKLSWKDCGGAGTHAKVTSFVPDTVTLGQKTTTTGTGSVDEAVTGGTFDIDVSAGFLRQHWTGDICAQKTFKLPLGAGTITWDGMKCPIAKGSASVATDIQMSSSLPAMLLRSKIHMKATTSTGDSLLCMEIDTSPATENVVVV